MSPEKLPSRLTLFLLAFIFLQPVTTSPKAQRTEAAQSTIRIGAVLATSGPASSWGNNAKNGMQIALKEINDSGGIDGRQLDIAYKDSETDEEKAAQWLQKLITEEHVQVVIGDVTSPSVLKMVPIAEKNRVVILSPGASSARITNPRDYTFRNWHSDDVEGKADARYAFQNLGWKRVTTLYIDNAYGVGLNKIFSEAFTAQKGEIIKQVSFPSTIGNYKEQITATLSERPDGIYLVGYVPHMISLLKQMNELVTEQKIERPSILSTQAFNSLELIADAGAAAEGVMFSVPRPPDPSNSTAARFREVYKREYGRDIGETPADCSDTGYDAVIIVANVLRELVAENKPLTGPEIRQKLRALKNFTGAAGDTTFDKNGDAVKEIVFKQVRANKFVLLSSEISSNPQKTGSEEGVIPSIRDFLSDFLAEIAIAIIGLLLAAFVSSYFLKRSRYGLWKRWHWGQIESFFRGRRRRANKHFLATLDDYVALLEKQRSILIRYCKAHPGNPKPVITIYVFTKQLPRDWPLWGSTDLDTQFNVTPLERYYQHFHQFLTESQNQPYSVELKRIIIIDSCESPGGLKRQEDLKEDISQPYFNRYISMLHHDISEAFVYRYRRPWPNWLSDAVFYGLNKSDGLEWLWGLTTSYDAGEDLIILRLHSLFGKSPSLRLPFNDVNSLEDLLWKMVREQQLGELINLDDLKNLP
jgi:branched-chain amino acid transport system substrate-binding protein